MRSNDRGTSVTADTAAPTEPGRRGCLVPTAEGEACSLFDPLVVTTGTDRPRAARGLIGAGFEPVDSCPGDGRTERAPDRGMVVNPWRLLHILSMFGAVAVLAGGGFVRNAVLHTGDVRAMRYALAIERRLAGRLGAPLLFAGAGFGIVTAVQMGYRLLAPWLVLAYGLLVLNLLNGTLLYERHARHLEAAAAANPGAVPSGELAHLIRSPRTWVLNAIDASLWLGLIFTMVLKPFG